MAQEGLKRQPLRRKRVLTPSTAELPLCFLLLAIGCFSSSVRGVLFNKYIPTVVPRPQLGLPVTQMGSKTIGLGMRLWSDKTTVLGLVGGIASGKSTVSQFLRECGASIVDADKLGHESYEPGTNCYKKLVEEFGENIVAGDGNIDRRALGDVVFGNTTNMARLQGIVWPEIRVLAEESIASHRRAGAECVVLEAAVMLEAGWVDLVDELWVVQVEPHIARKRLMARNSFTEAQANKRIASQSMSNEERASHAQLVLTNNGTVKELELKVKACWEKMHADFMAQRARRRIRLAGVLALVTAALGSMAVSYFARVKGWTRGTGLK